MSTKYKLTTRDMKTRAGEPNETVWRTGEWVVAKGDPSRGLCSDAYIHHYDHPLVATFLNPIHANIRDPLLWECEVGGETINDRGLKGRSPRLRILRSIPLPEITTEQRVEIAIRMSLLVYREAGYIAWAQRWLAGVDRSLCATDAAAAAYVATDAAAAYVAAYAVVGYGIDLLGVIKLVVSWREVGRG